MLKSAGVMRYVEGVRHHSAGMVFYSEHFHLSAANTVGLLPPTATRCRLEKSSDTIVREYYITGRPGVKE